MKKSGLGIYDKELKKIIDNRKKFKVDWTNPQSYTQQIK